MKEKILQELQKRLNEAMTQECQVGLRYLNSDTIKKQSTLSAAETYAKQQGYVNGLLEAIETIKSIKE